MAVTLGRLKENFTQVDQTWKVSAANSNKEKLWLKCLEQQNHSITLNIHRN